MECDNILQICVHNRVRSLSCYHRKPWRNQNTWFFHPAVPAGSRGIPWVPAGSRGIPRVPVGSRESRGFPWSPAKARGFRGHHGMSRRCPQSREAAIGHLRDIPWWPWIPRGYAGHHGIPRDAAGAHGIPRDPAGAHGSLRDPAGSGGSPRDPAGARGRRGMKKSRFKIFKQDEQQWNSCTGFPASEASSHNTINSNGSRAMYHKASKLTSELNKKM